MDGWIKIHRKMVEWEWYNDNNTKIVFLHLLLTANHKEKKWQGKIIQRGQKITSIQHLADETNLTPKQVRIALDKLKRTNEVTTKGTSQYTLVTIEKYSDYQDYDKEKGEQEGEQEDKQRANGGQTEGKQRATNKNDKNIKNEKNDKNIIKEKNIKKEKANEVDKIINDNFTDKEVINTVYDFIKMRKEIKKPITTKGLENLIKKLYSLSTNIEEQIEILNNSIMNSWQGIYPLKQQSNYKTYNTNKGNFNDFKDLWEEARQKDEQAGNSSIDNTFSW